MEKKLPIEELLYEDEGTTLDFKQEQYAFNNNAEEHKKSELLKDIIAFANAWRRTDAYILTGVKEVKGGRSEPIGVKEELDDAQLQQFVNSKTQQPIKFSYSTVLVDGVKVGVVRIPVQTRPFYLKKDYNRLKKNVPYIRRGSSTAEATPEEIYKMGQSDSREIQEIPKLSLEFSDLESRTTIGSIVSINVTELCPPPSEEIPDFTESRTKGMFDISSGFVNSNYNRELVDYYYQTEKSAPLEFAIHNDSNKVINDIRTELIIAKNDLYSFFREKHYPKKPESRSDPFPSLAAVRRFNTPVKLKGSPIELQDLGDRYRIELSFGKAQPQQTVFCSEVIFISASDSISLNVDAMIYADNIPIPIKRKMEITCNVDKKPASLEDIKELDLQVFLENHPNVAEELSSKKD